MLHDMALAFGAPAILSLTASQPAPALAGRHWCVAFGEHFLPLATAAELSTE